MQTKNTVETDAEDSSTSPRGTAVVKSFAGLGVAVLDSQIDEFALQVRKGIDNWRTAGKLLVEMTKTDPGAMVRIRERSGLSDTMLQTFARIGRNEIWPQLLADNSIGAQKLLTCAYDLQKKYTSEPIEVACEWKAGKVKTVKRKISELSRAECSVVFDDKGHINTLDQQAFRLREPGKKTVQSNPDPTGEVKNTAVRLVNVDVGYFSIVQAPDGTVTCEPCGRSPIAQPVRVIPNGKGFRSAIVLYYRQESQ